MSSKASAVPSVSLELFRAWLHDRPSLGHRSVADVCSRLRRLMTLIDFDRVRSGDDLTVAIIKIPEFKEFSKTVRSQLKRAGFLYLEFAATNKAKR